MLDRSLRVMVMVPGGVYSLGLGMGENFRLKNLVREKLERSNMRGSLLLISV